MNRDVLEQIPLLIDVCSLVIIADQTQVNSACLCMYTQYVSYT